MMRSEKQMTAGKHPGRQRGVAAVEFALLAGLLFTLLFGVMEMGRVLFYWNTAVEATRMGARLAVVCDKDTAKVKSRMQELLGVLQSDDIDIAYLSNDPNDQPNTCNQSTCRSVTVSITGVTVNTLIPFVPLNITMPPFTTTLPRESMDSANPDCS